MRRLLALFLFFCGCSPNLPKRSEIAGNYTGLYSGAKETFSLNVDGTFEQKLYLNDSLAYKNSGTWSIEKKPSPLDAGVKIGFYTFLSPFDVTGKILKLRPARYSYYWGDWDEINKQIEFKKEAGYYVKRRDE